MKLILIFFLIVGVVASAATALTIEEYIALPADEKKQVLQEGPDKVLDDLSKLLELHTIALQDESSMMVRVRAAESTEKLMLELHRDKTRSVSLLPEFSHDDSAAFQEALVAALWDDYRDVRESAAAALPLLAPPNPQIVAIITEAYEENRILVVEPFKRMAQVGYSSDRFLALAMKLLQSEYYSQVQVAADLLARFTPEIALDMLIELAGSKEASARIRATAVRALAAYGQRAMRAKSVLERIIEDHPKPVETREYTYTFEIPASELRPALSATGFLVDDETMASEMIGVTAARTLEAITLDKPKVASHYTNPIKLVQLWPLALPEKAQVLNTSSTEADDPNKLPSQIASKQERSKEEPGTGYRADSPEKLRKHTWIWLGALVLMIIAVWIVLKRRR